MAKDKVEKVAAESELNLVVNDPQVLRPKELPLVVTGNWKNDAQARFAATLNGYAYKNPEKWHTKKDVLIKQLEELGKNPGKIVLLEGIETRVSFKNKLIEG